MGTVKTALYLGIIVIFTQITTANLASASITEGHARFTVIRPDLVRMEYSAKDVFVDLPSLFAVDRKTEFTGVKTSHIKNTLLIDTGKMRIFYSPTDQPFNSGNLKIEVLGSSNLITWMPGQENKGNLGGTLHNLDHVGGIVPVSQGLLSRDGWYLIDDSTRSLVKGNPPEDGWVTSRPDGAGLDWYFFGYANDYHGALQALTTIGGAVPLPRRYVLGSWYSRWWPYSSSDYRQIVNEYREHNFPLDMVVMDMDWHKKDSWTGYTWNRELFPDAENYLKWLHDQDLHVTLNDHPQGGVGPYEDNYSSFMKAMNQDPEKKQTLTYNAGDQKYLNTLFHFMHEPLERSGVDFWWLDWMGDSNNKFNNIDWVNQYYYLHSEHDNLRGQQFSRWANWGDHRHPIHFSGDTEIAWSTLQFEVPFTASSGNVGAFYWSHDMGGFEGYRDGELLARWVQFGAFSAALRLHSTNKFYLDKRPWTYSEGIENSMRISYHLRSVLFPYIYSTAWQGTHDSLPLVRSLYLSYPKHEESYNNNQEYLFGDSFLVAPITHAIKVGTGISSQEVWIPDGTWYNWFTGEKVAGLTHHTVTADLNSFPLFVKGGMPIPMQPYTARMTSLNTGTLTVRAYPGEDGVEGNFDLYEDDGSTKDYINGHHSLTKLTYFHQQKESEITIAPAVGNYNGQKESHDVIVDFAQVTNGTVMVNGIAWPSKYDEKNKVMEVALPSQNIRHPLVVKYTAF